MGNELSLNYDINLNLVGLDNVSSQLQTVFGNISNPFIGMQNTLLEINNTLTQLSESNPFQQIVDKTSEGIGVVSNLISTYVSLNQELNNSENCLANLLNSWISNKIEMVATTAATLGQEAATKAVSIAQGILNTIMSMNPIMLVVIAVAALVAAFVTLWNNCEGFRNFFTQMWEGIKAICGWIYKNIITPIVGFFVELWEGVSSAFTSGVQCVSDIIIGIVKWISKNITTPIADFFIGLWKTISGAFKTGVDFIVGIFTNIVKWISKNVITPISGFFKSLWNGIAGGVENVVNFVIKIINVMIKGILSPFNLLIDGLNLLPGVNIQKLHFEVSSVSIPKFAGGGFVSAGQMFLAREAGPELVGTIGSRSAVANNDQIVESVSRGVYNAVRAAGAYGEYGGSPLEVKLYLDGKQLTGAIEKVQRERGVGIMNGGVVFA